MVAAATGGGRAARALRVLLLLVMALAAVEYLFGSYLETSPLKTYLYQPIYAYNSNATIYTLKSKESSQTSPPRHKGLPETVVSTTNPTNTTTAKNSTTLITKLINLVRVTDTKKDETINGTQIKSVEHTNKPDIDETAKDTSTVRSQGSDTVTTTTIQAVTEGLNQTLCPAEPPDLGPVNVSKSEMLLSDVEKKFPEVMWGGRYRPANCTPRHKVAIIVPYRDREAHLAIFLNHMHPFLMKQQIEYGIFIVEQEGLSAFNRAKLFNVGAVESRRFVAGGWQCFVFHDVDLLPMDARNLYSCPKQPRHMSAAVDTQNYKLPYEDLFGGVSAMTAEQFNKVNGYSNKYWGWGAEDDDMAIRLKKNNYHIARYKMSIARYTMLRHKKAPANPKRYQLLWQAPKNYKNDGLSTLRYRMVNLVAHHLYTQIVANIDEVS